MKLTLDKRERVIIKTRAHPRVLRGPFFLLLLLLAATAYALGFLLRLDLPDWVMEFRPLLLALLAVAFGVLLVIWCLRPWSRWASTYIFLTTERIVTKHGRRATGQHSIGLYAIHDIVAVVRPNARELAPGTLGVVLGEQNFNIPHVPAVARMRELCIGAITALPHFGRADGVNMEERVDGDPPAKHTQQEQQAHEQPDDQRHFQQQRGWTEYD